MWFLLPLGVTAVVAAAHVIGEWMEEEAESDYREDLERAEREAERERQKLEQHLEQVRRAAEYQRFDDERMCVRGKAGIIHRQLAECRAQLTEAQSHRADVESQQKTNNFRLATVFLPSVRAKLIIEQRMLTQLAAVLTAEFDRLNQQRQLLQRAFEDIYVELTLLESQIDRLGSQG